MQFFAPLLPAVLAAGATPSATPSAEVGTLPPTFYIILASFALITFGILLLKRGESPTTS